LIFLLAKFDVLLVSITQLTSVSYRAMDKASSGVDSVGA